MSEKYLKDKKLKIKKKKKKEEGRIGKTVRMWRDNNKMLETLKHHLAFVVQRLG